MLRRVVVVGLAVVLVAVVLFRFGAPTGPRPYTVLLAMRPHDVNVRDVFDALQAEFNAAHSDIQFRVVWGDTLAKLPLLVAAGKMPDLWEVANFHATHKQHLLIDLEPFFQRDRAQMQADDFFPELIEGCRSNGRLNLIPRWYNLPVMHYRPSHFREAGLAPPDETWTWDDFCRAGRQLLQRDAAGRVIRWGCDINYGWWEEWLTWVRQAGGDMFDPTTGRVALDTPEAILGFEFWVRKVREGWAPPLREMMGSNFLSGRFAMSIFTPVLHWRQLRQKPGFDWDIAPWPVGPRGGMTGEMAIAGLGITRDCRRPEAAWEVLKHITSPRAINAFVRAGNTPVRRSAAQSVYLAGQPGQREDPQHREALLVMLKRARPTPAHPRFGELAQDVVLPRLQRLLRDPEDDPARAARELTRQCNDVLAMTDPGPSASRWWLAPQAAFVLAAALLLGRRFRRSARLDPGASSGLAGRRNRTLLSFIWPWLIGFGLLVAGPMLVSFYLAQTDYVVGTPARYVGGQTYWNLLTRDPDFWRSLRLTALYTVFTVPLMLAVALGTALLLNLRFVGGLGAFRTLFFLPSLLPVAASSLMWLFLMHPTRGAINRVLSLAGIDGPGWFTDPHWALPTLVVVSLWGFGNAMLIFLAGLQDVPRSLIEAALIDGAGPWSRFRHVTLPCLSPVLFFNLVMGTIQAMQVFATAYIIGRSAGAVEKSLEFYVLQLYEHAFVNLRMGVGSAMAWVLFLIVVGLTAIHFALSRRWVHYGQ